MAIQDEARAISSIMKTGGRGKPYPLFLFVKGVDSLEESMRESKPVVRGVLSS